MQDFRGKMVLVTGGTSGIGRATAKMFCDAGAQTIVTGSNPRGLQQALELLGSTAHGIRVDARDMRDVEQVAVEVKQRFGELDAVFLNAGIAKFAPLSMVDEALYDDLMDVNVKGTVFMLQRLLQHQVLAANASVVVNTSVMQYKGSPAGALYAATKGALGAMVRGLAVELAPIRVNAVCPGPIATPIYGKLGMPEDAVHGLQASLAEKLPLRRMGSDHEVARAVLFLTSKESSFITGSEIVVDGGWNAT